jgi:hypothetical protein
LTLTEGVYQAVGANVTLPANASAAAGVYTAAGNPKDAGLRIGASVAGITAGNFISLTNNAAVAAIFTPTVSGGSGAFKVQFGKSGIVIPGDDGTSGAIFEVSGTVATAIGRFEIEGNDPNIGITLGYGDEKGTLSLLNGSILITTSDTMAYTAAHGTLPVGSYTGGAFTASPDGTDGVHIVTSSNSTDKKDAFINYTTKSAN